MGFYRKERIPKLDKVRFVSLDFKHNLFNNLLTYLHEHRVQSVLIEGGSQLLQGFIAENLWDEARVLEGNLFLGEGVKAPTLPIRCLTKKNRYWIIK